MVLIDTSCWTHALRRKGDPTIRANVRTLLESGQGAWCDPVRLELWNGVANDWDRQLLIALEARVPKVPVSPDVWEKAILLAARARSSGLNVPATDLIIYACAEIHGLRIEHADKHFDLLAQLELS